MLGRCETRPAETPGRAREAPGAARRRAVRGPAPAAAGGGAARGSGGEEEGRMGPERAVGERRRRGAEMPRAQVPSGHVTSPRAAPCCPRVGGHIHTSILFFVFEPCIPDPTRGAANVQRASEKSIGGIKYGIVCMRHNAMPIIHDTESRIELKRKNLLTCKRDQKILYSVYPHAWGFGRQRL